MNYEKKFIKYAQSQGAVGYSKLWRTGYPDFMVIADKVYLFEVKGKAAAIKPYETLLNKDQIGFFNKHRYSTKIAFFGKNKKWQFFYRTSKNTFSETTIWG